MKAYQKPVSALTSCLYILQICLLLLPCIILPSCIMTTTVQEIEDTVTSHSGHCPTKGENLLEGLLAIQIKNNAETVMLQMDSMEICNIQVADATGNFVHNGSLTYSGSITLISAPMQLHYGADTTTTYYCSGSTSKIIIPAQELTPWNTYEHPSKSKNTYVKIHGIYTQM